MISIQKALDEIRNPERQQPAVIQFVRATGKKAGSLKTGTYWYGGSKRAAGAQGITREKASASHKTHGTLPLTDAVSGEYETPLISHIRMVDGFKIKR